MNHTVEEQENQDPLTHSPGAHPLGVGVGAALGGAAAGAAIFTGAATGTVTAGPVGALVGGAIGAVAGGLLGKGVAEHYDPTIVEHHWRGSYIDEPYYLEGMSYEDYAPAYHLAAARRAQTNDAAFEAVSRALSLDYEHVRGTSRLDWHAAEPAARASWYKIYN